MLRRSACSSASVCGEFHIVAPPGFAGQRPSGQQGPILDRTAQPTEQAAPSPIAGTLNHVGPQRVSLDVSSRSRGARPLRAARCGRPIPDTLSNRHVSRQDKVPDTFFPTDVPQHGQKMLVVLDYRALEAALPHMSAREVMTMIPLRVRHEQAPHDPANRRAGRPQQQMVVQQAIAVQLKRLPLLKLGQRGEKGLEVGLLMEHVLPVVATVDHVVD
jgi:hypothetical protein